MIAFLNQQLASECSVVEIFNGFFNVVQVICLAYLANRAVHKDRTDASRDHDELRNIRKP